MSDRSWAVQAHLVLGHRFVIEGAPGVASMQRRCPIPSHSHLFKPVVVLQQFRIPLLDCSTAELKQQLPGPRFHRVIHELPGLVCQPNTRVRKRRAPVLNAKYCIQTPSVISTVPVVSTLAIDSSTDDTMVMPALPTEVWENVIDFLVVEYNRLSHTYSDELNLRRDLMSCALVCHAWRTRAQLYLFTHLLIRAQGLSTYGAIIQKSPILCKFAKEFKFYNGFAQNSGEEVVNNRTVETASHAVRVAHKLPNIDHLHADHINLGIEHPHLPRYVAALRSINKLEFISSIPTRLAHLVRFLIGFRNLSALALGVPIVVESNPLPLPSPCYATKSSLTTLLLLMRPGGHLLLDWLVKAHSFTTSLQILQMDFSHPHPQTELGPTMQGVQALLDNCKGHLREWVFWVKIEVDDFKDIPSVSLATNTSLTSVDIRVSKDWFKHGLQQLQTITSKKVTEIWFWYWLGESEKLEVGLWRDLDDILDADHFVSLTKVSIACVYRDKHRVWHLIKGFNGSEEFPKLLPKLYKRGILT